MNDVLNLGALRSTPVNEKPYPHFVIENFVTADKLASVLSHFPTIEQGGSFPLEHLEYGQPFQALADAFDTAELRELIEEKFDLDLSDHPIMITARGYSRKKDGRIHTDSKSKVVTLLLYLNDDWTAETGQLRVLNDKNDLDSFSCEIPPKAGTLVAFKVTDNCWHGYKTFEGTRRSIQVNYVQDESAAQRHLSRHGFTAKLKGLFKTYAK